jgi:hypothetical protein
LATGKEVSTKTVRRRLKEVNLIARKLATGPILTALHKRNRLSFCLNHQEWNEGEWDSLYSLMSPDFIFPITIAVFSFCEDLVRGTRNATFVGIDKFGGGSLIVWGGISFNGYTQLVIVRNGSMTGAGYRDDIIVLHVQPYVEHFDPNFIFMHNNIRPHIAHHIVTTALRDPNIDCLDSRL